jgi:hypothetical protein
MSTLPKKNKQSTLAIVSIGLTVIAFVLFILATFVSELANYNTILLGAGLGLLAVSWAIYLLGGRFSQKKEPIPEKVVTVIGCRNCDIREERDFQQGDFIPKELGPCKKCNGKSYIKAIYAVSEKKPNADGK